MPYNNIEFRTKKDLPPLPHFPFRLHFSFFAGVLRILKVEKRQQFMSWMLLQDANGASTDHDLYFPHSNFFGDK